MGKRYVCILLEGNGFNPEPPDNIMQLTIAKALCLATPSLASFAI